MQGQVEAITRHRENCPTVCETLLNILVEMKQNDMLQSRNSNGFGPVPSNEPILRQSVSDLYQELIRLKDGMVSIKQHYSV